MQMSSYETMRFCTKITLQPHGSQVLQWNASITRQVPSASAGGGDGDNGGTVRDDWRVEAAIRRKAL